MRKKQVKKSYSAPECMIIQVNEATNLMDTSFPSQHHPAQPGGGMGDAKQAPGWLSEEGKKTETQHGKTNRELLTKRTK